MSIWRDIFANAGDFFKLPSKKPSEGRDLILSSQTADLDFASSIVALAAKMAKADGITTIEEAQAFHAAFPVNNDDKPIIDKLFALAGGSALGYEGYARKIAKKYPQNRMLKMDILAILFLVAAADGQIKPVEKDFLINVSQNLGLSDSDFSRVSQLFIKDTEPNPFVVLGVHESDDDATIKSAWLKIVVANHPDNYMARGEPKDFLRAATEQTAMANSAYSKIKALRNNKA
jgi:DnaJ like chaperone protein